MSLRAAENYLICRTCLSENGEKTCIFDEQKFDELESRICDAIGLCASVQVCRGDGLPELMCVRCVEELKRAFLFRKLCEKSDAALRHLTITAFCGDRSIKVESEENVKMEFDNVTVNKQEENGCEVYKVTLDENNDLNEYVGFKYEEECSEEENEAGENSKLQRWRCKKCDVGFETRYKYRKHKSIVHDPSRECQRCGVRMEPDISRDVHVCDPDDLLRVAKQKTTNRNVQTICNVCHKSVLKMNLTRHLLTHTGQKPFVCNICGKGFTQRSSLKTHTYTHSDDKPFKCDTCDKSFSESVSLRAHRAVHTGEKPFNCEVCGKGFTRQSYLKLHVGQHKGETDFRCERCDRNFINSHSLAGHMRTHTGEKPYECTVCGTCFAVKEVLKNHMRRHTGERPFPCTVCGWAFAKSSTMVKHMKVHKRDDREQRVKVGLENAR